MAIRRVDIEAIQQNNTEGKKDSLGPHKFLFQNQTGKL
jgi:hypothetical protein